MNTTYAVVLIEPVYNTFSLVYRHLIPKISVLDVYKSIEEAEEYRTWIIEEDNLIPDNVSVVQYT